MLAAVAICGALVITVSPSGRQLLGDRQIGRTGIEQYHLAGLQQRADAGGQLGLVAAVAGQALAQRPFLGRRQHGAAVDALAQALGGELAQVAADRIFGDGITARQFGGDDAALLAQLLEDLPGALGG